MSSMSQAPIHDRSRRGHMFYREAGTRDAPVLLLLLFMVFHHLLLGSRVDCVAGAIARSLPIWQLSVYHGS